MKKIIIAFAFLFLMSCAAIKKQTEPPQPNTPSEKKKNSHLVDLCSYENLPRYPFRPKLYPSELQNLTEEQMDVRIKEHIRSLDKQIDKMEAVVVETRKRVEMCR